MAKKPKRRKTPVEFVGAQTLVDPTSNRQFLALKDWLWGFLLVFSVVAVYWPVWRAGFTWDDDMFISANPCVVGPLGLTEIWTTSAARFYPLVLTTFWFEHALWGLSPLPYHLVNILLHASCAVALWRILERLAIPGAWLGAALWALHPVQVETVAWVSEMKNTESCLFFLLTILFFIRDLSANVSTGQEFKRWNYPLALTCTAFAMASKSSTLLLPVILALCVWWVRGRWSWREMGKVLPVVLMAVVAAALTSLSVKQNGTDEMQWAQTWQERLITGGYVFWFYLGKLLWPHPLITFYPRWQVDTEHWISYFPLAAVALVPAILWIKRRTWSRGGFFAFLYYLLNLLPVMGLFAMTGFRYSLVEDHLQYLASMGPLALAGAGLDRLSGRVPTLKMVWLPPGLAGVLLLFLGILSWQQSWIYQSEHTLWTYNLKANPASWLAYDGLGVESLRNGNVAQAIELYRKSISINPNYAVTHSNLGVAFAQLGRTDEAIAEYQRSLAINPNSALVHLKLGEARLEQGQSDDAMAEDQKALALEPKSILALDNLGLALAQKGDSDEAIEQYRRALEIDPNFALALNNLGVALFQKGQVPDAIEEYQKALHSDPSIAQTRGNLALALAQSGIVLLGEGRVNDAIDRFQEALENDSTIVQAHSNLGIAFVQKGDLEAALAQFQEAVRLRPDDDAARANLIRIQAMMERKAGP